jgi:flagellar protein FlbD
MEGRMIKLTRLDKRELCVNPDLIKTAEAIPDTIITLTTGERMYVRESVAEVVALFVGYQHAIREQRAQGVLAPPVCGAAAADGPDADHAALAPLPVAAGPAGSAFGDMEQAE